MADSLELKLEALGEDRIRTFLNGVSLDLRNLRGAMNEVGRGAVKTFSGPVFASRGQFIGESWPRLSDDYAARKAKKYSGRPVLVRTGEMQGGFKYESTGMSVTIYNPVPHFVYHQSTAPRTKIPRRAMIGIYKGLDADVRNTVAAVIARKIQERAA